MTLPSRTRLRHIRSPHQTLVPVFKDQLQCAFPMSPFPTQLRLSFLIEYSNWKREGMSIVTRRSEIQFSK